MKIEILDDENTLSIDEDYSSTTLEFFPDKKEFESNMHLKEDLYYRTEKYKYKISLDPIEVYIKLIERKDEPPESYKVKDGVVLKSEIIKKDKDFLGKNYSGEGTLESIANLEKEVEWNKLSLWGASHLIFFTLSKHPEIISNEEYRKFLRLSDERIKNGLLKIEKFLIEDSVGLKIFERHGNNKYIWYPDNKRFSDEKQKEAISYVENKIHKPLFNSDSKDYSGISEYEFNSSSTILKSTNLFLNKKESNPARIDQGESTIKKGGSMKWIIVIVLSVVALSWGIWTAIGVFVLGTIIINIMAK